MKKKRFLVPLALLVLTVLGALILSRSQKPQYCRLIFGPDGRTRVLLCFQGEGLSVDREEDKGRLGPHKRFSKRWDRTDLAVPDRDGKAAYVISRVGGGLERQLIWVDIKGSREYQQYCDIGLSDDPKSAPLAHFDGPLTVKVVNVDGKLPSGLALRRGDKPTDLQAFVGTFDPAKGCWVVVQSDQRQQPGTPYFPEGVCPVAEVEFPPRSPGSQAVKLTYPLDKTC